MIKITIQKMYNTIGMALAESHQNEIKQIDEKKGGPYAAKERKIRRESVAEMFFEKGYSALNISRMLNVNRNTVTNDLKICFSQLQKEYFDFDPGTICMTQFHRMEIQRSRLVDLSHKNLEFRDRLTLERMISEIENRIMQAALRIAVAPATAEKLALDIFNIWAKKQNPTFRGISGNSLRRVSVDAREKIEKIIDEDQKKTLGFTYLNANIHASQDRR